MNAEQYLKDHESEVFKKIAEAMGREYRTLWDDGTGCYPEVTFFNPLVNSDQWIECLMWYKEERSTWNQRDILTDFWNATESREALLIAILDTCGIPKGGE